MTTVRPRRSAARRRGASTPLGASLLVLALLGACSLSDSQVQYQERPPEPDQPSHVEDGERSVEVKFESEDTRTKRDIYSRMREAGGR